MVSILRAVGRWWLLAVVALAVAAGSLDAEEDA